MDSSKMIILSEEQMEEVYMRVEIYRKDNPNAREGQLLMLAIEDNFPTVRRLLRDAGVSCWGDDRRIPEVVDFLTT